LNEAKSTLQDVERRASYDKYLKQKGYRIMPWEEFSKHLPTDRQSSWDPATIFIKYFSSAENLIGMIVLFFCLIDAGYKWFTKGEYYDDDEYDY
jgi:DnaJ-class molecular chaperone